MTRILLSSRTSALAGVAIPQLYRNPSVGWADHSPPCHLTRCCAVPAFFLPAFAGGRWRVVTPPYPNCGRSLRGLPRRFAPGNDTDPSVIANQSAYLVWRSPGLSGVSETFGDCHTGDVASLLAIHTHKCTIINETLVGAFRNNDIRLPCISPLSRRVMRFFEEFLLETQNIVLFLEIISQYIVFRQKISPYCAIFFPGHTGGQRPPWHRRLSVGCFPGSWPPAPRPAGLHMHPGLGGHPLRPHHR